MPTPTWLTSISDSITSTNKKYPELFIFTFITIGVLFFFSFIKDSNKIDSDKIKGHRDSADCQIQERFNASPRLDSINLCKNLKVVSSYIDQVKQSKMLLATKYQKYLIICFTIGIFFVTLTAVIAFVVTKKGWDNSSRIRKGLLLSCAFYGLLLTAFPKLFDQDQNYRTNFSDYTALSNTQLYIFKKLSPYLDKRDNSLNGKDSILLSNVMDTATTAIMQHSNIDISLDKKQLDGKKIEF
ncbi:MAG TPA: hypothetical protein VF008_27690 [Niastella sp.]